MHHLVSAASQTASYVMPTITGKEAAQLILRFHHVQHLIVEITALNQAGHEQAGLFLIHEKAVFKRTHMHLFFFFAQKAERDSTCVDRLRAGGNSLHVSSRG